MHGLYIIVVSTGTLRLAVNTQAMDVLQIILHVLIITVTSPDVMSKPQMDAHTRMGYVAEETLHRVRAVMARVEVMPLVLLRMSHHV